MTMNHPKARKICTNFDSVCLEGGCGYCNEFGVWMEVTTIRTRALGRRRLDFAQAFHSGLQNDFYNAQVRYEDGSLKFTE